MDCADVVGLAVLKGKWTFQDVAEWRNEFQEAVTRPCPNDTRLSPENLALAVCCFAAALDPNTSHIASACIPTNESTAVQRLPLNIHQDPGCVDD